MVSESLIDLCKDNVGNFAELFFPHLLNVKSADFHKTIYEDLSSGYPFSAFEVFRGGAKSTIGLIIKPIHFALFKPIGDISLISKSEAFVLNEITRKIKAEFKNNKDLIALYHEIYGTKPETEKWAESYFVLSNGIAFEGCGIGGQLRGGRRGLVLLDDLEDEETASSEEQRDKLKRRVNKELIPKLLPKGEMVYFGTPIHQLCYLHQVIQTPNNGWHKRIFPAFKEDGTEQWVDMFPKVRLEQIKLTMGSNYFAAEYLCNPTADMNVPIKESQIRYWEELPKQYSCVIAVDPAFSDDESADYKVAVVVGIDQANNRYLLDYIRTHDPTGVFQDNIINLYHRWKPCLTSVGLPFGTGGDKEFFKSLADRCMDRKVSMPLVELKDTFTTMSGEVKRKKIGRIIAALQPHFERGQYYISSNHMEAREEILTIGQSRWDDLTDSMAYAEQILQPVYYDMVQYQESVEDEIKLDRGATGYE